MPFSDLSPDRLEGGRFPRVAQTGCRITATTADVHELIRANLHRAPMYDGQIADLFRFQQARAYRR